MAKRAIVGAFGADDVSDSGKNWLLVVGQPGCRSCMDESRERSKTGDGAKLLDIPRCNARSRSADHEEASGNISAPR